MSEAVLLRRIGLIEMIMFYWGHAYNWRGCVWFIARREGDVCIDNLNVRNTHFTFTSNV